jgi:Tol biopolymer transport system component
VHPTSQVRRKRHGPENRRQAPRRSTRTRSAALIVGIVAVVAIGIGWLALPRTAAEPQGTQPPTPTEAPRTEPAGFLITANDGTGEWPINLTALPAGGATGVEVAPPNPDTSSDWDWSPDLTRVVWMEQIAPREPGQRVVITSLDGSDALEIGTLSSFTAYRGRAWSADSRWFAYASTTAQGAALTVVDVTTGTVNVIARWHGSPLIDVDWFPDASRLVVAVPGEGISTMARDGSDTRQISDLSAYRIGWSPTGTTIVAEAQGPDDETPGVWLLGSDGSDEHRVSAPDAYDLEPVWSPDGAWIAFSRDTTPAEPRSQPQLGTTVFLMRPDGSDLHSMLPAPDDGWNEVWDWRPNWHGADHA